MQIEFDYYITPDGLELNLNDYNVSFVMSSQGQGMAPIGYQAQSGPYQHGASPLTYRLMPRTITMILVRKSYCRTDYWQQRALLIDYLRPNRQTVEGAIAPGVLRKILPDGTKMDLDVYLQDGLKLDINYGESYQENRVVDTATFIAFDPVFYASPMVSNKYEWTVDTELVFNHGTSTNGIQFYESPGVTADLVFGAGYIKQSPTITYTGTWAAYPIITLHGPMDYARIENLTTAKKIVINGHMESSQSMVIDLSVGAKTITLNSGANAIGRLSEDSDMSFSIEPSPLAAGGVNSLYVFCTGADENSYVKVEYNTRYIGI